MSTLITGARGGLGRRFATLLPDALTPSSAELDVADAAAVDAYVRDNRVDRVVHCAAKTAVRYCEQHKPETFATNVGGTRNLCDALAAHAPEAYIAYISTACVFPGDDPAAVYTESSLPQPKNFYALTKLLGEYVLDGWAACSPGRRALVIRTNFAERGPWAFPTAFTDRFGTYLYPETIAEAVVSLMAEDTTGTVHVCGDRLLSMFEFARMADPGVEPMTLADYDGPPLTVNMALGSERISPLPLR